MNQCFIVYLLMQGALGVSLCATPSIFTGPVSRNKQPAEMAQEADEIWMSGHQTQGPTALNRIVKLYTPEL